MPKRRKYTEIARVYVPKDARITLTYDDATKKTTVVIENPLKHADITIGCAGTSAWTGFFTPDKASPFSPGTPAMDVVSSSKLLRIDPGQS